MTLMREVVAGAVTESRDCNSCLSAWASSTTSNNGDSSKLSTWTSFTIFEQLSYSSHSTRWASFTIIANSSRLSGLLSTNLVSFGNPFSLNVAFLEIMILASQICQMR
ncbi:hypothetical protein O181_054257 [Austropuccinia psidii MF-1]|uniref:Uncharacterized protein n=1 Tax=Austropuccinia psidii MF-1 TaxID=1389203 RepID=A0A9Q3HSC6_9BASI|nr:hypothetical protein [Austropuccinia psidii MF-1]